jgi:hypothetical protein
MTSLNETEQIEQHLLGQSDTGNALLFEACAILDPGLRDKVLWQKKAYNIIQSYARRQLKKEIEAVHQKLFTQPEYMSFSQKIRRLFTNR